MEYFTYALDWFLHLQDHLTELVNAYGPWVYAILFLIIFLETGLVFTPFLPGDSLIFAVGALAAGGSLSLWVAVPLLCVAAVLGDAANYWIGKLFGQWIVRRFRGRWLKQEHLDRTHAFFEKYGGKTIIIARFVPIVRTFAPFVAGIGAMTYPRFQLYNVVGGIAWVVACSLPGYFFGQLEIVKQNFELVVLAIVFISVLPIAIEWLSHRRRARAPTVPPPRAAAGDPSPPGPGGPT